MQSSKRRFLLEVCVAAALYAACTAAFFYPVFSEFGRVLIGPPEDNMGYLWNLWWGKKTIGQGNWAGLTYTEYLNYPIGASLLLRNLSFYNLCAGVLLSFVIKSLPAVYNLLILHGFFLGALGGFFLIRYLTGNFFAALAGGFIFAFNPSHAVRAEHHLQFTSIQWLPLFLLFHIKALRGERGRPWIWAALFFFLNAACSWYDFFYAGLILVFSYLYLCVRRRRLILLGPLWKCLVTGLPAVLVSLFWLVPMAGSGMHSGKVFREPINHYVVDLLSWVTPFRGHTIFSHGVFEKIRSSFTGTAWDATAYLGWANLVLLLAGYRLIGRRALPFALGMAAFVFLSMGSALHVMGRTLPVPLPYRICESVPGMWFARTPARATIYVYLFLAILVSMVLARLVSAAGARRFRPLLLAVVPLLLFADFFRVSYDKTPAVMLPAYQIMEPGEEYGIFDFPVSYVHSQFYMLMQTFHGKPNLTLHPHRIPGHMLVYDIGRTKPPELRRMLLENNIRYIFVHKEVLLPEALEVWVEQFSPQFELIYQDSWMNAYRVADREVLLPGTWRDAGFGPMRVVYSTE